MLGVDVVVCVGVSVPLHDCVPLGLWVMLGVLEVVDVIVPERL